MKTIRCAIYTRKSNEEGLDKEFNTLEAQREAGENYIKSQMHQGWQIIPKRYDDGGFSGGNMKRPALKELMRDIENGFVDMIVVYKIDRLTRSLIDFCKMIEVLDAQQCSFVSVTQNFNTADSMGRLMLNILLSFAQFEREISGERIRDKIAASRKKGMWTGGCVPLGYDVVNKKLVINEAEADAIKVMFGLYLENPSEVFVSQELNQQGFLPKAGKHRFSAVKFNPKIVTKAIQNPIYIGKIPHKNELYDGQHQAIVDVEIWEEVNRLKKSKERSYDKDVFEDVDNLLQGLLVCDCCQSSMRVSYTKKNNRRYRYYASHNAIKNGYKDCQVGVIPAVELDALIVREIAPLFKSPDLLYMLAKRTKEKDVACQTHEVIETMNRFDDLFNFLTFSQKKELLSKLIEKITVQKEQIIISFKEIAMAMMDDDFMHRLSKNSLNLVVEFHRCRVRGKTKIVMPDGATVMPTGTPKSLLTALHKAFVWQRQMDENNLSLEELARYLKKDRASVSKIVRLNLLAPNIIQAILDNKQPITLSQKKLLRTPIPPLWEEQRALFGFSLQ